MIQRMLQQAKLIDGAAAGREGGAGLVMIRRLGEADWEAFRTIRLEALRVSPEAFGSDLAEQQERPPETWAGRLRPDGDDFVLGAFDQGGQIIGMAGFSREGRRKTRHKGSINGVFVSPQARGAGIGRALMTAMLQQCRSLEGLIQVSLWVVTTNEAARNLYRTLGFATIGREPRALRNGDTFVDEDWMLLRLDA